MKKLLIIALVVLMIPVAIFAKGFSFGIGATATTGYTIEGVENDGLKNINPDNFKYGAYANVKIFFVSANATLFPVFEDRAAYFDGDISANLALDIFFLRVQAGLSVKYIGATDFKDKWIARFETEDIMDAPLSVRAEVDAMLGDLNIGVWGILPTPATLNTLDKLIEVQDEWKNASLGIALGFCF